MTSTQLKEKLLKEAGLFDADVYRDDIRDDANKYGVKYKENYDPDQYGENQNNMGNGSNSKKALYIGIAVFFVLAISGGAVYYYKFKK